jgi:signal transduction histidine kinase
MTTELSTDFGDLIARRIHQHHRDIAERWLRRLEAILPVETASIFPTADVLDHIPVLIQEIADYVGAGHGDVLVSNTQVFSKARELGELRFSQRASVHQLLREYRILAAVLGAFVHEQFTLITRGSTPGDVVAVMNRLNEAVFVLLQTTVDTFVGRYTEMIEDQTTRLEGFNRMVSHELRQPLSSVMYAVELLRGHPAPEGQRRERVLEVADRNVRRLADLLGMLGAIARPDHDTPQLQEIDLSKLVQDVLRQLRDAAQARAVSLVSHVPRQTLTADVSRLELVLVNLVSNGIKYSDPSREGAFVEVGFRNGPGTGQLLVRDNGLGIPAADQPKIFHRFFRAHAKRDGELGTDGVGLGLAIAAECVKAMHGTIAFESIEGAGTTFIVTLPHTADQADPLPKGTDAL